MAQYSFIPWVRQGLVQAAGGLSKGRLRLQVKAKVADASVARLGAAAGPGDILLFGPGDVTSLDAAQVIRQDPPAGTTDFEPNHLAFVEFDRPDLPWIFSLGSTAAAAGQLRPWLCLVVVKKRDGEVAILPATEKSLPVLEIKSGASDELPDLAEAWAWAHSQVVLIPPSGGDADARIKDAIEHAPHQTLSRLICPRKLAEKTSYYACLVPTYQGGCEAGLGLPVNGDEAARDAWSPRSPQAAIRLPVYLHWEFGTSARGDFKSLALQLTKTALSVNEAGTRELDLNQAGYGLPNADPKVDLEGALTPDASAPGLRGPTEPYRLRLNALVNGEATVPTSVLPPPLYGRWHAAERKIPDIETVDGTTTTRDWPWLKSLNLDPRYRVPAGLGAQIVREQQESLMASAWDQLRGAKDANQMIGQAQQALAAAVPIYRDRVSGMDSTRFLLAIQPMAARVTYDTGGVARTAQAHVQDTALPQGSTSAQFRRILRTRGSIMKRFGLQKPESRKTLIEGMNTGQLLLRPLHWPEPAGMTSTESLVPPGKGTCGTDVKAISDSVLADLTPGKLKDILKVLRTAYRLLVVFGEVRQYPPAAQTLLAAADQQWAQAQNYVDNNLVWAIYHFWEGIAYLARAINVITRQKLGPLLLALENDAKRHQAGLVLAPFVIALGADAGAFEACESQPEWTLNPPLAIDGHMKSVLLKIDPAIVIPKILGSRIDMPGWKPETLEFVRACPDFPAPMYRELAAKSQDWMLPGLEKVPPDSVTIVQGNSRFIESFMVGLNHEMSRELLWRGFPTDQRGTYFRQFWDPSGRFPAPLKAADVERGKDIPRIHTWRDNALGTNLGRNAAAGAAEPPLVLLVRGSLLRRFPRAMVTLVLAEWANDRRVPVAVSNDEDEARIRHPLFRGELPSDVSFLGFRGSREEVIGNGDRAAQRPGWFIVFEQQATEPRFGLEAEAKANPKDWRDLAWPNVATLSDTNPNLHLAGGVRAFPANTDTPGAWRWIAAPSSDSAQIASIALRRPVRVCIHASELVDPA